MDKKNLRVGAAKAVISFPEDFFSSGGTFTGIHDDIHARALILENGEKACIISLELPPLLDGARVLKELVSGITGIPSDSVWITTTYNFSAPHMLADRHISSISTAERTAGLQLNAAIYQAVEEAAQQAMKDLRPARVFRSVGESEVNAYRNIRTSLGWWIGLSREIRPARELNVFRFCDPEGKIIATLYHYAVRSSVLYHTVQEDGRVLISSDLSGCASSFVEEQSGGVAIHLPGACADQVPREIPSCPGTDAEGNLITLESKADALNIMERLGIELGCDILRVCQCKAEEEETPGIAVLNGSVPLESAVCSVGSDSPALTAEWTSSGETEEQPLSVLRIGHTAFLGIRPELNHCTAEEIRERTMFLGTLTVQTANNTPAYLPDRSAYEQVTYQALRAGYLPGSAEKLVDAAAELLQKMQDALHNIDPEMLTRYPDRIMDIPYGNAPEQKLDIWYPNDRSTEPLPVVLMLHGGAFQHGCRFEDSLEPMLSALDRGFAVVSADYRLAPAAHFPAPIHDGRNAIRFLRANAEKYGLDGKRIALWGYSSGGWLVSFLALTAGNPAFEGPATPWSGYSERVQAVIDWCGPCGGFTEMDPAIRKTGVGFADHDEAESPESLFMGAKITDIPELCRLACPMTYITPDAPPFLIVHGTADPVVPYDQSERFCRALKNAGVRVQFHSELGKGHCNEYWYTEERIRKLCCDFLDSALK